MQKTTEFVEQILVLIECFVLSGVLENNFERTTISTKPIWEILFLTDTKMQSLITREILNTHHSRQFILQFDS